MEAAEGFVDLTNESLDSDKCKELCGTQAEGENDPKCSRWQWTSVCILKTTLMKKYCYFYAGGSTLFNPLFSNFVVAFLKFLLTLSH